MPRNTPVNWNTLNAARDTLQGCLLATGEERALTEAERVRMNELLRQADDLAAQLYDVASRGKARFALAHR